jgi:hypothetical protein
MSSWSLKRRPGGVNSGFTCGICETSTTFPLTRPAKVRKSSSRETAISIASAVTGPSVPGVQARGNAISGNGCGETTLAVNFSFAHPRPNGPHGSCRTLASPQPVSRSVAHFAAAYIAGELVSRGPETSLRYQSVSMTCERWSPSSLIL